VAGRLRACAALPRRLSACATSAPSPRARVPGSQESSPSSEQRGSTGGTEAVRRPRGFRRRRGLPMRMIAIPEMPWTAFAPQNDVELSQPLLQMARQSILRSCASIPGGEGSASQDSSRALDRRLRHDTRRTGLLVLDEVGSLSQDSRNADLLFQGVSGRLASSPMGRAPPRLSTASSTTPTSSPLRGRATDARAACAPALHSKMAKVESNSAM
jgi:hypothetical protein